MTVESDLTIESWGCDDCPLSELEAWEKEIHEDLTGHTIIPVYR